MLQKHGGAVVAVSDDGLDATPECWPCPHPKDTRNSGDAELHAVVAAKLLHRGAGYQSLAKPEPGQTRAPAWGGGGCGQQWPLAAMWVPAIVAAPPLSEELLLGMWWKQQHVLSTVASWWLKDGAPGGETRRMRCDSQQVCLREFPPQNQ